MSDLNRILYVEDEADIRTVAQLALESVGGFQVMACPGGKEAVASAPQFAPDLIVLDVMMPGMDGPTTLAELRKLDGLEKTPVVFMTAKVQPPEIDFYKSLGAVEVIVKPFDPMALSDQVRAAWRTATGA